MTMASPPRRGGHLQPVLHELDARLPLPFVGREPVLLRADRRVQVEQLQAVFIQPAADLLDLWPRVDEIGVPVVAPVDVGEAGIRDTAEIGRRIAPVDIGVVCSDGEHVVFLRHCESGIATKQSSYLVQVDCFAQSARNPVIREPVLHRCCSKAFIAASSRGRCTSYGSQLIHSPLR